MRCVASCIPNVFFFACFMQFLFTVFKCAFQFMLFPFINYGTADGMSILNNSKENASVSSVTVNVSLYIGVHACTHVTMP